jgi:hypothetical protein
MSLVTEARVRCRAELSTVVVDAPAAVTQLAGPGVRRLSLALGLAALALLYAIVWGLDHV